MKYGNGKLYTPVGTEGYMAPEILKKKEYSGSSVDLFAVAIITFVMKSKLPPF